MLPTCRSQHSTLFFAKRFSCRSSCKMCVQRAREATSRQSASNFWFGPVNCFSRRAFVRHHSRAAASNGASVRKSGRRTPSARASRVARTAPSRATFARHCRRSCRRRLPATPRPASTVAAACALGVLAGGGELQLEDPRQPAGRPATPRPTSTVAAACALGVLAGGGELQLEDPRPWSTRGAAEPASALAASLARPLPLRAWGALPTWGSMIIWPIMA